MGRLLIRDYVERILIMVEPPNSNSIKKELKIERILPIDCIRKEMGL